MDHVAGLQATVAARVVVAARPEATAELRGQGQAVVAGDQQLGHAGHQEADARQDTCPATFHVVDARVLTLKRCLLALAFSINIFVRRT